MLISAALSALLTFSASQEPRPLLGLECRDNTVLAEQVCHSIREAIIANPVVKFAYTGTRTELRVVAVETPSGEERSVSVAVATVAYGGEDVTRPTFYDIQVYWYPAYSIPQIGPYLVGRHVERLDVFFKEPLETLQRER